MGKAPAGGGSLMATTEQVPTNEQIARLNGWEPAAGDAGKLGAWIHNGNLDEWVAPLPDYLSDPSTLGEAEALCKERGWSVELQGDQWANGDAEPYWHVTIWDGFLDTNTPDSHIAVAMSSSLTEAWWVCIVRADGHIKRRASETEKEATG